MKFGDFEIKVFQEGLMMLDGGATFGAIPRVRWERRITADSNNRVPLGVRQMLVRGKEFNLLVDTGFGTKHDERTRFLYGLVAKKSIRENLAESGLTPEDITHVIFTHLHTDHSGGATIFNEDGTSVYPTFPNAVHYIQDGEWQDAASPNEFNRVAYLFENFLPILHEGKIVFLKGNQQILNGIRVHVTGGHTRFHQMVQVSSGTTKLYFIGDLIPTTNHLPLSWRSSGDLYPVELLHEKKKFLETVLNSKNILVFSHDSEGDFKTVSGSPENPIAVDFIPGGEG